MALGFDDVTFVSDAPDGYTRLVWLRDEDATPGGVAVAAAAVRR